MCFFANSVVAKKCFAHFLFQSAFCSLIRTGTQLSHRAPLMRFATVSTSWFPSACRFSWMVKAQCCNEGSSKHFQSSHTETYFSYMSKTLYLFLVPIYRFILFSSACARAVFQHHVAQITLAPLAPADED